MTIRIFYILTVMFLALSAISATTFGILAKCDDNERAIKGFRIATALTLFAAVVCFMVYVSLLLEG